MEKNFPLRPQTLLGLKDMIFDSPIFIVTALKNNIMGPYFRATLCLAQCFPDARTSLQYVEDDTYQGQHK